jgi:hypothetical protein
MGTAIGIEGIGKDQREEETRDEVKNKGEKWMVVF